MIQYGADVKPKQHSPDMSHMGLKGFRINKNVININYDTMIEEIFKHFINKGLDNWTGTVGTFISPYSMTHNVLLWSGMLSSTYPLFISDCVSLSCSRAGGSNRTGKYKSL